MSATLRYQPIRGKSLNVGAPSSFQALLERVFGQRPPLSLDPSDVDRLRTAAAATDQEEFRKALEELAEAVEKHGDVRLWAEY